MRYFSACSSALALCLVSAPVAIGQAAATTAAATTASAKVSQFQKLEDSWSDAVNRRDQYELELVLSPLLMDISATGDVASRDQQVANLLSGNDKTLRLEQRVVTVRMLGDIAVANGSYDLHHRVNSAEVDERGVFTHVFQRDHGRWKCINAQRTQVRQDAAGHSKGGKKSNSDSRFHIPLFPHDKKN